MIAWLCSKDGSDPSQLEKGQFIGDRENFVRPDDRPPFEVRCIELAASVNQKLEI